MAEAGLRKALRPVSGTVCFGRGSVCVHLYLALRGCKLGGCSGCCDPRQTLRASFLIAGPLQNELAQTSIIKGLAESWEHG